MLPVDGGPLYAETDLSRFPAEPWNTGSNFILLAVVVYWAIQLSNSKSHSVAFAVCLLLTFSCFIGGTVYHATRSHFIWLVLDGLPLLALFVFLAAHSLYRAAAKNILTTFLFACALCASAFGARYAASGVLSAASRTYLFLAVLVAGSTLIRSYLEHWKGAVELGAAVVLFAAALTARESDFGELGHLSPVGTHFLWHILGGCSLFFALKFLAELELASVQPAEK